jgi:hypothetical protein
VRFLAVFLASLAVLSVVYAAIARWIDPRGDFGTRVFPVVELDARAEKMRLFRAYAAAAPPEGLILGSSRAMKVRPDTLERATGRRFFNFAVDNARAEDYLAIYRWAREQGARLKVVVVGLDVEALHNDDRAEASLLGNDALLRELREQRLRERGLLSAWRGNGLARTIKKTKAMFTSQYVADSVRAVRFALRPASRPLPLMDFEADGYLRYRRWESERAAGTFRFEADLERCITRSLGRFDTMTALSPRRRAQVEQLVEEARADGARVIVWITSLHPLTTEYLESHTSYASLLEETREYQQGLARTDGVATYDFSRPESYRGDPRGWYDCLHIDEGNADRVVAALDRELR